jgi:hypothetical protein
VFHGGNFTKGDGVGRVAGPGGHGGPPLHDTVTIRRGPPYETGFPGSEDPGLLRHPPSRLRAFARGPMRSLRDLRVSGRPVCALRGSS